MPEIFLNLPVCSQKKSFLTRSSDSVCFSLKARLCVLVIDFSSFRLETLVVGGSSYITIPKKVKKVEE